MSVSGGEERWLWAGKGDGKRTIVGMYCMKEELIFNLKKKVYFSDNMKVTLVFNIHYVVDCLKDIVICEK